MKDITKQKNVFRFMLILTTLALAAVVTLIVFSFLAVDTLGLWQCLLIGVMMVVLVVLTTITVVTGLNAYGRK